MFTSEPNSNLGGSKFTKVISKSYNKSFTVYGSDGGYVELTNPGLYLLVISCSNINGSNQGIIDPSSVKGFTPILTDWSKDPGQVNYIGYLYKTTNTYTKYQISINPSANQSGSCTVIQNCWKIE